MSSERERILVVDDSADAREVLARNLTAAGYGVITAPGVAEAVDILEATPIDLVITDLKMPRMTGLSLLDAIKSRDQSTEVLLITGYPEIKTAVDAIKRGAYDFIEKPLSLEKILLSINNALDYYNLEQEINILKEKEKDRYRITGDSEPINYLKEQIRVVAPTNAWVLISGENGTGKELVARAVGLSRYVPFDARSQKFVGDDEYTFHALNLSALSPTLIESELFGYEKGAFTGAHSRRLGRFEVADGATLFLDEIGDLPLELQPKLLRVIQDGEFERLGSTHTIKIDVRIIAATNRNLEEEVRRGRFREDLWYRLNIFPITMPPLRDRLDDIPLLVDFYVKKISKRMGKSIQIIPTSVMNALQDYHWPGNVRELENVLERAVINSSGPKLRLVDELKKPQKDLSTTQKTLEAVERDHIVRILEQTQWKVNGKNGASEILGLNRSTLRARMRKLGILKP